VLARRDQGYRAFGDESERAEEGAVSDVEAGAKKLNSKKLDGRRSLCQARFAVWLEGAASSRE